MAVVMKPLYGQWRERLGSSGNMITQRAKKNGM